MTMTYVILNARHKKKDAKCVLQTEIPLNIKIREQQVWSPL